MDAQDLSDGGVVLARDQAGVAASAGVITTSREESEVAPVPTLAAPLLFGVFGVTELAHDLLDPTAREHAWDASDSAGLTLDECPIRVSGLVSG